MNTPLTRRLLLILICGGILGAAAPVAYADRDDDDDRGWRHHKQHRGWDERTVYRERVIIRERPRRYREPEVHHHYYERPYRAYRPYSYSRSPAIVIGVDIPPIVIPLR
ncbi:MAG TPA: hypothetical protein PKW99_13240 [Thauera sp.]|nr:hypothetical protein [Thauera sp.]